MFTQYDTVHTHFDIVHTHFGTVHTLFTSTVISLLVYGYKNTPIFLPFIRNTA